MYYKLFRPFLLGSFAGFWKKKKVLFIFNCTLFYKVIKNEQDDMLCLDLFIGSMLKITSEQHQLKDFKVWFLDRWNCWHTQSCTRLKPLKKSGNVWVMEFGSRWGGDKVDICLKSKGPDCSGSIKHCRSYQTETLSTNSPHMNPINGPICISLVL